MNSPTPGSVYATSSAAMLFLPIPNWPDPAHHLRVSSFVIFFGKAAQTPTSGLNAPSVCFYAAEYTAKISLDRLGSALRNCGFSSLSHCRYERGLKSFAILSLVQ